MCQVFEKGVCTLKKNQLKTTWKLVKKMVDYFFCAIRFTGDLFSARCFAELILCR